MRAVVQRVTKAKVTVEGDVVSEIMDNGLLILLGIGSEDTEQTAFNMAKKIAALRIFQDDDDKMNLSVRDVSGEAIVVSQFTLYADTHKGNRPSFINAAPPEMASPLVDRFVELLTAQGVMSQCGVFGAHMQVELLNDGPVTIILEM